MDPNWQKIIDAEKGKKYFGELTSYIDSIHPKEVFPPRDQWFNAFQLTPWKKVKVVILGQDPYIKSGQAMGLSFSVPEGIKIPPSLKNIFKELGCADRKNGDLTDWAKQGVFLLNTCLTVTEGKSGSHSGRGWERFTSKIIKLIANHGRKGIVFMLWGGHAQKHRNLIPEGRGHLILESSHPSPFSARISFLGSGHFKLCNNHLKKHGRKPIEW